MAENCNECSIAWIRGSDYAEISAYNGSTLKNRTLKLKEENPEDVKVMVPSLELEPVLGLAVTVTVTPSIFLSPEEGLTSIQSRPSDLVAVQLRFVTTDSSRPASGVLANKYLPSSGMPFTVRKGSSTNSV